MSQFPSPAQDYVLNDLSLDKLLRPNWPATSLKRMHKGDDTMVSEGIMPNSIIVVNNSIEPVNGCWVYAIVDRQKMVRTFYKKKHLIELHPGNINKNYPVTYLIEGEGDWVIIGVVTSSVLIFKFK